MGQQWIAAPTPHNSVWNEYLAVQDYWLACAALFMTALVELSIAIAVVQLWLIYHSHNELSSVYLAKWCI